MANEVFIDSISKQTFEQTKKFLADIDSMIEKVGELNKRMKEAKFPSDAKKTISAANAEIRKSNRLVTDSEKARKRLTTAYSNLNVARSRENRAIQQLRVSTTVLNREVKEEAVLNNSLVGAYQKLNLRRTQAARRLRDLIAAGNTEVAVLRQAQREFDNLSARVRRADLAVRDHTKNVGNYQSALGRMGATLRTVMSAFGLASGIFLFANALRDSARIMLEFEKANASLAAILQVNIDQMGTLIRDSQRLGAVTAKSATEVTKLQIAYARLGFSQQDILDLTEGTIAGSIALNANLDETAALVGAVVRTFDDLQTSDAAQILDVLSLSTAKSALEFERLQTALPIVSGAANAAGIPFERLIALLGRLSDAGIDASMSATALRNIFIESAAQGLNYEEILEKISGSTDKLTAANDEFGKRAAVSATVLAQNLQGVSELDEALQNAAGTAQEMADKQLDTLNGQIILLKSAWEGLVLSFNDGDGILNKLARGALKAITDWLTIGKALIDEVSAAWNVLSATFRSSNKDIESTSESLNGVQFIVTIVTLAVRRLAKLFAVDIPNNIRKTTAAFRIAQNTIKNFGIGVRETNREIWEEMERQNAEAERQFIERHKRQLQAQRELAQQEQRNITPTPTPPEPEPAGPVEDRDDVSTVSGLSQPQLDLMTEAEKKAVELKESLKLLKKELGTTGQQGVDEFLKKFGDIADAAKKNEERLKALRAATDEFLKSFQTDFFQESGLSSLEQFFDGSFERILEGAESFEEKFAVTFTSIAEVAQEAFNLVTSFSNRQFETAIANAQKERDVAIQFAGDSAAAREAIEQEYEERVRQIRARQAEAEKKQAIFNAVINTAQAVVAALPNIPLSVVVGALGAAQVALIASTPIPEFKDGVRNFEGGMAMVNDRKGGQYKEVITTPDGKVLRPQSRNALVNLPKGSNVYRSESEFHKELNTVLAGNDINPLGVSPRSSGAASESGIDYNRIGAIFDESLARHVGKLKVNHVDINKRGVTTFAQSAHGKKVQVNNRVRFK